MSMMVPGAAVLLVSLPGRCGDMSARALSCTCSPHAPRPSCWSALASSGVRVLFQALSMDRRAACSVVESPMRKADAASGDVLHVGGAPSRTAQSVGVGVPSVGGLSAGVGLAGLLGGGEGARGPAPGMRLVGFRLLLFRMSRCQRRRFPVPSAPAPFSLCSCRR